MREIEKTIAFQMFGKRYRDLDLDERRAYFRERARVSCNSRKSATQLLEFLLCC